MKRILVLTGCFIALTCACFAQDVIVTKDAKKINAKVTEVNVDNIKYKNFDNLEGPTYTLPKSDIVTILYQNGQVETFETEKPANQAATSTPVPTPTQTTAPMQSQRFSLSNMQKDDPILYQQYLSGRKQSGFGSVLLVAGGVMSIGGVVAVATGEVDNVVSIGTAAVVTGGVCVTAGIPLVIIGGTKKNNALNAYRRKYTSTQTVPHFQLNMQGNGLGLAYVF